MDRSNDVGLKRAARKSFSMAREIDPLPFTYSRSAEGYGWQEGRFSGLDGRVQKGPLLVALSRYNKPTPPLRPDLFIHFVGLDPKSLDDCRDFAGEYGFLRGGFPFRRLPSQSTATPKGTSPVNATKADTYVGETQAQWEADLLKMQAAYQLHRAIRDNDIEALKKAITWEGKRITYRSPERTSPSGFAFKDSFEIAIDQPYAAEEDRTYRAELFERLRPNDLIMPARIALQDLINDRMAELVTYQLRWVHSFKRMG